MKGKYSKQKSTQYSNPESSRATQYGIINFKPKGYSHIPPPVVPGFDPPSVRIGPAGGKIINGGIVGGSYSHPLDLYGPRQYGDRHEFDEAYSRNSGRTGGLQSHGHINEFIPGNSLVDPENEFHAADGGSESKCSCQDGEFICSQTCECFPKSIRCDGIVDCGQGEDEKDCQALHEEFVNNLKAECDSLHRVMCPRTYVCIVPEWLCDGDDDCGDYSDETQCGECINIII